mmetsp:Transcript_48313/g.109485  ORF Transcript_48313/g.109485 Transcript_48313/m.109485 type:complete len:269 (+) Transcript_48313:448-1254(+)
MSSANLAGETLAAASRFDLSIVSRMYFAKIVASCNSVVTLRIVSCNCLLSTSLSACVLANLQCASSSSCLSLRMFSSRSRSSTMAWSSWLRSSPMVASCWASRSADSVSNVSTFLSRTLIFFLYLSISSLAFSSSLVSLVLNSAISPTFLSTSSCMLRFLCASASASFLSSSSSSALFLLCSHSRRHIFKTQWKNILSPGPLMRYFLSTFRVNSLLRCRCSGIGSCDSNAKEFARAPMDLDRGRVSSPAEVLDLLKLPLLALREEVGR